jgi:hypothetical protein
LDAINSSHLKALVRAAVAIVWALAGLRLVPKTL